MSLGRPKAISELIFVTDFENNAGLSRGDPTAQNSWW
jgi:hypothetical protein